MPPLSTTSLEPGKLRHRVQVQTRTSTKDGFGGESETWTTIATAWAAIRTLSVREAFAQQNTGIASQATHSIQMRKAAVAIAPGMRVVFGSHRYKVQGIDNVELQGVVLNLTVLEIQDAE